MKTKETSMKKKWTMVLYLSILFSIVLIGQDLFRELVFFGRDLNQFEQSLEDGLKASLKSDIEAKEELVNFQLATLEEDFRAHIKENLNGIKTIVEEAYFSSSSQLNDNQVIDLVSRYQNKDLDHHYMLITLTGDVLYSNSHENGTNLLLENDAFGRKYYDDITQTLTEDHEVYLDYYLLEDNQIFKYKAYASKIDNQPFFLLTFAKEHTYKSILKEELVEAIRLYGQESTGDVFVYEQTGQILIHKQTDYIGLDVLQLNNPYLRQAKQVMDFVVSTSQAGFVTYTFQDQDQEELYDKIAYLTYIEELDLVLGSSIDDAYYAPLVTDFETESLNRILYFKIPIYLALFGIAITIYIFVRNNINASMQLLEEEEKLYQRFADLTKEIILITNQKGQILFLNSLGERTLRLNHKEKPLYLDELLKEEESYFIMHAPLQTYYVQFNVDDILYQGQPSKLYLFQDITENVESLREIESVTTKDDLTSLGNRRMMNQDYRKNIIPYIRQGETAYLSMIDLDYFKTVNDTYGHVYGDQVLKTIANIMKETMDEDWKMYRIGGDEFALFATNIEKQELILKIDQIRKKIEGYPYEKPISISFSAGIATIRLSSKQMSFQDFYYEADRRLYKAKNQGKRKTIG